MELTISNPVSEAECPTCGTVTARQYIFDPGAGEDDYRVCEACLHREVNQRNDGLYGLSEWHKDRQELNDAELIQLIETEFVRGANTIRWDSRVMLDFDSLDQAERLVEEDRLDTGVIGVDEAKSFRPTVERRFELIKTFDLLNTWDVGHRRRQMLKDEIQEELGNVSF